MSILSTREDGAGFYYGVRGNGDMRQINIRFEPVTEHSKTFAWAVYVGGERVGMARRKDDAEIMALEWMDKNPNPELAE
jgi:hypothetical protein